MVGGSREQSYFQDYIISNTLQRYHDFAIFFSHSIQSHTVKPVLVATSIKQATCIKQACVRFPKETKTLNSTCVKQAPISDSQRPLLNTSCTVPFLLLFANSRGADVS